MVFFGGFWSDPLRRADCGKANEIASRLNTSTRNVHRWAERERWTEVLELLGYDGERNFRVQPARDTQRDAGDTFEKAHAAYIQARRDGVPKTKRIASVAQQIGIKPTTLRE